MMSRRLAPRARRMPISRVRSVTVASMMFMMPMPPTSREMAAMEPSTMLKICLVRSARLSSSRGTTISIVLLLVVALQDRLDGVRDAGHLLRVKPL